MPRFLPRAWAIAAPRQRPTSSTLWCASTSRSPLQLTARSKPPWQAKSVSMWSRKPTPVCTSARPETVELKAQLHGGLRGLAAHFTVSHSLSSVSVSRPWPRAARPSAPACLSLCAPSRERAAQVADEDAVLPERLHILPRADKAGARQDEVRARIRQLEAALHELRSQAAALEGYAAAVGRAAGQSRMAAAPAHRGRAVHAVGVCGVFELLQVLYERLGTQGVAQARARERGRTLKRCARRGRSGTSPRGAPPSRRPKST